jgi:hypothetical protein
MSAYDGPMGIFEDMYFDDFDDFGEMDNDYYNYEDDEYCDCSLCNHEESAEVVDKHLIVNGVKFTESDKENVYHIFCDGCGRSHELCDC